MKLPAAFLDEIRSRLPLSVVVGRTVKLRRQGREYVGLSPFKPEKTPSFFVNDQKARWFDFADGTDGDAFDFLVRTRGLSFMDAVGELAKEAGLDLPKRDPEGEKREARRLALVEINAIAAAFFRAQLPRSTGAEYLTTRGISAETIEAFGIGYAQPDRSALKTHLAAKGIDQDSMIQAGLLVAGDDIPVSYDRFRDRVMFPIRDHRGRVIAFGGRAMKPGGAKYLNSPETPVFQKGRVLFNIDAAKAAAAKGETPIIGEGYFDVVSSTVAGFRATVAPMGTALSEAHLTTLWHMHPEPIIALDGDRAGLAAAYRTAETALPMLSPGRSLRFALMPEGQDPDDVVRKRGPEAYRRLLERPLRLVDLLWRQHFRETDLSGPDRRVAAEKKIDELVALLPAQPLRDAYRTDLRSRLAAVTVRPKVVRSNGHSMHSTSPASIWLDHGPVRRAGMAFHDAVVVAAAAASPEAALDTADELVESRRLTDEGRRLLGEIVACFQDGRKPGPELAERIAEAQAVVARVGLAIAAEDAAEVLRDAKH